MTARIYKPSKTAMQSGQAATKDWLLEFEPEEPRTIEPLMGWTSSGDMKQQVKLTFDTKEEAVAYCEHRGIAHQVFEVRAGETAHHVLFGQFRLYPPRSLDPLKGVRPAELPEPASLRRSFRSLSLSFLSLRLRFTTNGALT